MLRWKADSKTETQKTGRREAIKNQGRRKNVKNTEATAVTADRKGKHTV